MTAPALLARLHELGVAAERRGEGLALRPASAVPPALLAELRQHKAEVLALLAGNDVHPDHPSPRPDDCRARLCAACDDNRDTAAATADAMRAYGSARARDLAGAFDDPEVLADRAAIAAEPLLPASGTAGPPQHPAPPADLVASLSAALATDRPWQRSSGPTAEGYWHAEALRRLAPLDPLARGLLVQAAEAQARRWVDAGQADAGTAERQAETVAGLIAVARR